MKKVRIDPAEQRVVILPDEKLQRTASGIYIPPGAEDNKPEFGTIIATGSGSKDNPMEYRVGETVLYSEYAGTEVELNLDGEDREYKVMNQMDIMAKILKLEE
jgi:chaperonin GroES